MSMIKITFCLKRRKDLTHDQFQSYWAGQHAPLVRSLRGDLRIVRYVQSRPFADVRYSAGIQKSRGSPAGYDGVAEIWWRDANDLNLAISSAEGRLASEILLNDERKFIDLENSPIWYAVEDEIFSETAASEASA
jgi:uncharacterized protein (TIGR02118 family)